MTVRISQGARASLFPERNVFPASRKCRVVSVLTYHILRMLLQRHAALLVSSNASCLLAFTECVVCVAVD